MLWAICMSYARFCGIPDLNRKRGYGKFRGYSGHSRFSWRWQERTYMDTARMPSEFR